ncbi:N-acetylmuramoyl-L-alanine amidase [Fundidesulfovibrio terrae]|uniref:N-acetylmuramoyl-L-alanine amidase n=1 Tax=Fundidesulfovibrio terrae TaxID=2922866 RepID=UPI001FAF494F|nr:N-acetylmuramoyl-L-alanine amidase [Fundidesulfovibrio terrae]
MNRRTALTLLSSACLGLAARPVFAAQDKGQELASKGHELLLSGKPAEALSTLKEAAKLDPSNPWVFNLMGRAAYAAGQFHQAAESFRMALRIDPGDGYARMMLDVLSQRPLPPPPVSGDEPRPSKHKRASQMEEDAKAEMDAFAKTGKVPGKRLILIDPGHGGADKGVTGASGLAEKAVALDLARRVAAVVEEESGGGAKAVLTREADFSAPLWTRSAMAALFGADLFVSLHCSGAVPGRGGVELYTYAPEPSDAQAAAVAEFENGVTRFERVQAPLTPAGMSQMELVASWQARRLASLSRDAAERIASGFESVKPLNGVRLCGAPLKVLQNAGRPAVLIESGFLSNPGEEAALASGEFLDVLARSLGKALTRSLG